MKQLLLLMPGVILAAASMPSSPYQLPAIIAAAVFLIAGILAITLASTRRRRNLLTAEIHDPQPHQSLPRNRESTISGVVKNLPVESRLILVEEDWENSKPVHLVVGVASVANGQFRFPKYRPCRPMEGDSRTLLLMHADRQGRSRLEGVKSEYGVRKIYDPPIPGLHQIAEVTIRLDQRN